MIEQQYSSPNFADRPQEQIIDMVLIHYTNMATTRLALARLCDVQAKVSAHYLIAETGKIFALVDEAQCAWHAGVAFWRGETNINGCSIGIELAHQGHDAQGKCAPFPENQMLALVDLLKDISTRHKIPLARYLGHSDVAPSRKIDPGEAFDWHWLAEQGFGQVSDAGGRGGAPLDIARLQQALNDYGYEIELTGENDVMTQNAVRAFQRHFCPEQINGIADAKVCVRLADLLGRQNS